MKQNRFVTAKNARAIALALMLFVYPIIVLSFASIRYTETIHRISTSHTFDQSLFGSVAADSLAALGFLTLFTGLAFSSKAGRMGSVAIFVAGIALYFASPGILQLAGITTLPALIALLAITALANRNKTAAKESQSFHFGKDELYRAGSALLVIIIILEIGALAKWVTHPFFPSEIYSEGDPSWRFAKLESALFHSLGLLSPYLVALIAFSFFYKWFMPDLFRRVAHLWQSGIEETSRNKMKPKTPELTLSIHEQAPPDILKSLSGKAGLPSDTGGQGGHMVATYAASVKNVRLVKNAHWIILTAALLVAPLGVLYPHLPGVNPNSSGISTDEQYYMSWMAKLRADGNASWTDSIVNSFTINRGDRPLTLLIILVIANLTGSPDLMVIRFLPMALAPMLVFSNFVLLKHVLKSKEQGRPRVYAALGAIFAAFSPQIVVGEYAGFFANWMALVAGYFAFYFLIKGWESQRRYQSIRDFAILFVILLSMMLIHLYTWAHFLAVILLFSGLSFVFARKSIVCPKFKIALLLAFVVTAVSIDLGRSIYFSTPAAADADSVLSLNILPQDTSARWDRLFFTISSYVGGFLTNPVLLLLGLVWMVRSNASITLDRIFLAVFFILAIPLAIGSIEFQTRVMYNIPFHLCALLALYSIDLRNRGTSLLFIMAICLVMATYSLHAMANLYLELPEGYSIEDQFLLP